MFSHKVVATTSGGGWFFNDLLYSTAWQGVVGAETKEAFLDGIGKYYLDLISHVYEKDTTEVRDMTTDGEWTGLSMSDWFALLKLVNSWEMAVVKHHYMYSEKPSLQVEDCHWSSTFGVAQDYNDYKIYTSIPAVEDKQRGTWHTAIPGMIDYDFSSAGQNPEISIHIPMLDNWYASVCSLRKTNEKCKKHEDCIDHSYCDIALKKCICDHGFTVITKEGFFGHDSCRHCPTPEDDDWDPPSAPETVDVHWDKWGFDETKPITIESLKEKIFEAINDPKKYSGPSSAAGAVPGSDSSVMQEMFSLAGLEASWLTPRLTEVFDNENAPPLSLIDGGGFDNCGITALVRKMQHGIKRPDMHSLQATIVGMCSVEEVSMLISDMVDVDAKLYEMFQFEEHYPKAQLIFEGKHMQVWRFKVKTLWEPLNGIIDGAHFTIYAHSFPQGTSGGGIGRNWGVAPMGGFDSNHPKYKPDQEKVTPFLSLMLGRGEVFEVQLATQKILDEMTLFATSLGYGPSKMKASEKDEL